MKKNGFTVVELIVTFSLTAVITIFLFQIVILLKNIYVSYGTKTELLNKTAVISHKINDRFNNSQIKNITKCGSNCLEFMYVDSTSDKLIINKIENSITFGEYKTSLIENSSFGDIFIDTFKATVSNEYKNDSFLMVNIPIENSQIKEHFSIAAFYRFNSLNSDIKDIVFDESAS